MLHPKVREEDVRQARKKFLTELIKLENDKPKKGNPKTGDSGNGKPMMTPRKALEITKFFFDDCMGPEMMKQLRGLSLSHNQHLQSAGETPKAYLTNLPTKKDGVPNIILDIFQLYAVAPYRADSESLHALQHTQTLLEINDSYTSLVTELRASNGNDSSAYSRAAYLKHHGFETETNITWATVASRFLEKRLQLNKHQLRQDLNEVKKVKAIRDSIGRGALLLLPPKFLAR